MSIPIFTVLTRQERRRAHQLTFLGGRRRWRWRVVGNTTRRPPPGISPHCAAPRNGTDDNDEERRFEDGLAFIHVSKAGGTSVRRLLSNLAAACGYRAYTAEYPKWRDLPESTRSEVRVYGGSNHLGYADLLQTWPSSPGERDGKNGHANKAFVTQLRHPWDRAASDYHYALALGTIHHLYELTQRMNETEWIRNTTDGKLVSYFGSDLEEAKDVLRGRFAAVGLVEEPVKSLEVLRCRVPWIRRALEADTPLLAAGLPHENRRMEEYSGSRDEGAARALFPLDFELYRFARDLLFERHADCARRG
uniref:Sulfotransferase domain-containing protein n=1 Tax=Odontella aurita TaxID=265563 RepID=A0A7S4HLH6_9STRA